MSLKAGNTGLNLIKADYVYLVDPWWNPAVEAQAIDRTHRIGQIKNIFAYRMICKNTIEEKILELQSKKKKLASDLVVTDENVFKSLEKDELMGLFL
ncbi:MAG: SWF/SNF helicase family protein [Saprospiraceae bacterium]|nr:SWF/SNF helicase family protein [Saprospiraceae bacterium]